MHCFRANTWYRTGESTSRVRVCESRANTVFNQSAGGFICIICIISVQLPHLLAGIAYRLRYGKSGNKKRATCFARLLQNELNSDFACFTTHIKPVLHQISLLTGLKVGGKTCNIAIQLVLQQCCKSLTPAPAPAPAPAPTPTPRFTDTQFKLFFVSYCNSWHF